MTRLAIVAGGLFALLTALVAADATTGIDDEWNEAMIDTEVGWLVDIAQAVSWVGSTTLAIITAVVIAAVFAFRRRLWDAAALVAIAVAAFVVSQVVKVAVDRQRPPNPVDLETSGSYPSASVMVSATAIALGAAVLASRHGSRRRTALLAVAVGYVVLMAWSRTYLRAHWLTDVAGGAAGGLAIVAAGIALLAVVNRRAGALR
ncbi:MAG: phosphatase PAP2 family protein [Actinomycetota bacterium]